MPMPRINSGELCVALERVAHIAVEDNELGALSPLAPAFAPSSRSGANRIVAPSEPPEPSFLSKVPDACHASRTAIGHEFALLVTIAPLIASAALA